MPDSSQWLLPLAAIGSALVGGLFFAFSTFIMRALDRIAPAQAIAAMQSINVAMLNPLFFLAFFGTAVLTLVLAILPWIHGGEAAAPLVMTGALLYLLGAIGVTMAFNVPLNNRLAALDPAGPDAAVRWSDYRGPWTAWNHVRTLASLLASAAFILAIRPA